MTFYIQGYKLDDQKIRDTFPREDHESEKDYDLTWYQPIIRNIPESAYNYIACGVEPDGRLNVVLVLDDGYDKEEMKKRGITTPPDLPPQALRVLTPGIWPSWDHLPQGWGLKDLE